LLSSLGRRTRISAKVIFCGRLRTAAVMASICAAQTGFPGNASQGQRERKLKTRLKVYFHNHAIAAGTATEAMMTYQNNNDSPPGNSCQPAISRTKKIPKRTNARQIAQVHFPFAVSRSRPGDGWDGTTEPLDRMMARGGLAWE
jgi:hypothetical protein